MINQHMKKILLTFFVLLGFVCSNESLAQSEVDSSLVSKYVYCEIVGTQKLFSTKITVSVDFGQEKDYFYRDSRLRDEQTGKVHTFNSMVDALNFMGSSGWEFVQAYTVTIGQQNVYHYLLKKLKVDN
jgi:hypothetical protein